MKKIDTTKKIPLDSIIRVYKKGFGYSKLAIIDVNEHFLGAYVDDDFINFIKDGDIVDGYLWVENHASYDCKLQVIGRINTQPRFVFFSHSEDINFSKERRCLKAQVNLPFIFFIIDTGDAKGVFTSEEVVHHNGIVMVLSDREAVFASDISIPEQSIIRGHLKLNNQDIEIVGSVQFVQDHGASFHYGISFNAINSSERNRILDYVISIYRE